MLAVFLLKCRKLPMSLPWSFAIICNKECWNCDWKLSSVGDKAALYLVQEEIATISRINFLVDHDHQFSICQRSSWPVSLFLRCFIHRLPYSMIQMFVIYVVSLNFFPEKFLVQKRMAYKLCFAYDYFSLAPSAVQIWRDFQMQVWLQGCHIAAGDCGNYELWRFLRCDVIFIC